MTTITEEKQTAQEQNLDINERAIQMVDASEQADPKDLYNSANELNKSGMLVGKAMEEVERLQETQKQILDENFGHSEFDMDALEESILNDGALKLMPDPSFWTFNDVKKHFTDSDGQLVDVDLDMDDERKKEYILEYARYVYMNHYQIKEAERLTEKFKADTAEINTEITKAIQEMDMERFIQNGIIDMNSTLCTLLEKEVERLSSKEELTEEESQELDNVMFTLSETRSVSVSHIADFIKTRTSRQILNTYKKNSKSIVNHLLGRIKQMNMVFNSVKWNENVKDFENKLFPDEKIGRVGSVFVFILSYYAFNRKDIWTQADTVVLRRVLNDLLYLFDDSVELSEENIEHRESLVQGIREVLEEVVVTIEKAGHDYVKVFN